MQYALAGSRPSIVGGGRSKILESARSIALGTASSLSLTEDCLTQIFDPAGEGKRTFVKVWADEARITAKAQLTALTVGADPGS